MHTFVNVEPDRAGEVFLIEAAQFAGVDGGFPPPSEQLLSDTLILVWPFFGFHSPLGDHPVLEQHAMVKVEQL